MSFIFIIFWMMKKINKKISKLTIILLTIFLWMNLSVSAAQSITERYQDLGKMYIVPLSSAPFPHPDRLNGHTYNGQKYPFQSHYSDSSVAIFIPKNFKGSSDINIIVYLHGWFNYIDSSCSHFRLIEQFSQSHKNAVFVFPQGPYNAPDSHGGKLEDKDGFKNLIEDVLLFLSGSVEIKIPAVSNIILAGHSGAYRAISFCLEHGGMTDKISEVLLFDGLYGRTDIFLDWIRNSNGRFINIYTDNGGTKKETENMMVLLDSLQLDYFKSEEKNLKTIDLSSNRLIFIHSDLGHNEVISKRSQFELFLKTSRID